MWHDFMSWITRTISYVKHNRLSALAIAALLVGFGAGAAVFGDVTREPMTPTAESERIVETASVNSLLSGGDRVTAIGTVSSSAEARIVPETAGRVVRVYRELGDRVSVGTVIAALENARQRAAVLQAEAQLESAEANLQKVRTGARTQQRDILQTRLRDAHAALDRARTEAVNAVRDAYATADDAVRNKTSDMFSKPRTERPELKFTPTDYQLRLDLEWERFVLGELLEEWFASLNSLDVASDETLLQRLTERRNDIQQVRSYLDKAARAVGDIGTNTEISESTLTTWQTNLLSARSAIANTLSQLSSAHNQLTQAQSDVERAQLQFEEAEEGGRSEDVAAAEAQVKQARAALLSAQAALADTHITAPINGVISSHSIDVGNFVSATSPVVTVTNPDAVVVETFLTDVQLSSVRRGAQVTINDRWNGEVIRIAPTVDSATGKAQVDIRVSGSVSGLVPGSSVNLEIMTTDDTISDDRITVPLEALQIRPDGNRVFTVEEGVVVGVPVEIGTISGDRIEIRSGLSLDDVIVVDARGIKEGQRVRTTSDNTMN